MTIATKTATYHCALCGRKLKPGRWVFSRFTGARYCWPGECRKVARAIAAGVAR